MEALYVVFIICTLLPQVKSKHWFFHGFEFFRAQLFIGAFAVLLATFIFGFPDGWSGIFLGGGFLICMLYQFSLIFPYTPLASKKSPDCSGPGKSDISLISANVLQTNSQTSAFIDLIRRHDPDIFVTLETNTSWEKALDTLSEIYPHQAKVPQDNLYGMHLYSKLELVDSKVHYLVEKDIPSIQTKIKLKNGTIAHLFSIHPPPPSPTEKDTSIERDGELMIIGKKIQTLDGPVIVCGDLNDVAWSRTTSLFLKLTSLLDPRKGRGFYATFHANYLLFRTPIDHLFHSEHFCLYKIKRLPKFGSDHFAMLYQLSFMESSTQGKAQKEPNEAEMEEIHDMIEEAQS